MRAAAAGAIAFRSAKSRAPATSAATALLCSHSDMSALLGVVGAAVALGASPATVQPCVAAQLTGSFTVINGSAGAGNISCRLRLRNRSSRTCFVSGLAGLRLLGKTGRPLPTRVTPAFRPGLTAVRVVLRPGHAAKAEARFTPDVPGPGEPVDAQCEPTAYRVRITPPPGGGTLVARIMLPTPVCVHGAIALSALSAA
jgi:Domain of unknown function (DUF4232)